MQKKIPEKFLKNITKFDDSGFERLLWSFPDLLTFLDSEECKSFVILGADIYKKENDKFVISYDNWSIPDRGPNQSFEDYSNQSIIKAKEYLQNYKTPENHFADIVYSSEPTAGF